MRRFFLLFSLFLSTLVQAACPWSPVLYGPDGRPSERLLDLLEYAGIVHDGSWESVIEQTQQTWYIGTDIDCFPMEKDLDPEKAYVLFSKLYLTQNLYNQGSHFDYAAIHGATVQVIRQRLWYLKKLWDKGIRFRKLVFLTGDRPLSASETKAELVDPSHSKYPFRAGWSLRGELPKNETEVMLMVFEQLDLPKEWYSLPRDVVDAPKPEGKSRPNTRGTLIEWRKHNPQPGSVLFISSQPFIGKQDSVARQILPATFCIDTVGEGFSFEFYKTHPMGRTLLFDALARWIFEEREGFKP